jgi:hypothetical protein
MSVAGVTPSLVVTPKVIVTVAIKSLTDPRSIPTEDVDREVPFGTLAA